jgi:hypothetical protein
MFRTAISQEIESIIRRLKTTMPASMLDLADVIERSHSQRDTVSQWRLLTTGTLRRMTSPYWIYLIIERAALEPQNLKGLRRSITSQRWRYLLHEMIRPQRELDLTLIRQKQQGLDCSLGSVSVDQPYAIAMGFHGPISLLSE